MIENFCFAEFACRDAVLCASAAEEEIVFIGLGSDEPGHFEYFGFENVLKRGGKIDVISGEGVGGRADGDASDFSDPWEKGLHDVPLESNRTVEAQGAALIGGIELGEFVAEGGFSVGSEAHDFVFGPKGVEAKVASDEGLEQAEAVFVGLLPENF